MKLLINTPIKNLQGKPFTEDDPENEGKEIPLSLGMACMKALIGKLPTDSGIPANIRSAHWEMAKKIKAGLDQKRDFVEIPTERVALIKNRVWQVFDTFVAGPVCDEIEGEAGVALDGSEAQGS